MQIDTKTGLIIVALLAVFITIRITIAINAGSERPGSSTESPPEPQTYQYDAEQKFILLNPDEKRYSVEPHQAQRMKSIGREGFWEMSGDTLFLRDGSGAETGRLIMKESAEDVRVKRDEE
ncbi:MAG: hypothetical protein ACNA78_03835 [Balneolaceae bacterium]